MATTNYSWNTPTVGGDEDTWGDELNETIQAIDTQVKANADVAGRTAGGSITSASSVVIPLRADQNMYRLDLLNIDPAIDAQRLGLQFSLDGGLTYASSPSDYSYAGSAVSAGGAEALFGDIDNDRIVMAPLDMTNVSGFCQRFTVDIFAISGVNTIVEWRGWFIQAGSLSNQRVSGAGRMASAFKPTHVRVLFPAGNVARCFYNVAARGIL